LRAALRALSEAWRAGGTEELRRLFHPDAVIAPPGSRERVQGAAACAESYADFVRHATILAYEEGEPQIDVIGDTAVALYDYAMTYELDGARHHDAGRDLLVLAREEGGWRVAWRTLLPGVGEPAPSPLTPLSPRGGARGG